MDNWLAWNWMLVGWVVKGTPGQRRCRECVPWNVITVWWDTSHFKTPSLQVGLSLKEMAIGEKVQFILCVGGGVKTRPINRWVLNVKWSPLCWRRVLK